MCVAFQVTQSGRQSRVSKSWWLTEVERDGDINHCRPLKRAKRHISNQHWAASWGRRGDMRSSWQLTGPLCVTAEKPGQDTRIWAPGWMHVGWADPSLQQALAFISGAGSMSVSEISFGLQFPSPTSSFISCCIVATAAQGYFLQVGQLCCLRDCRDLSFPWEVELPLGSWASPGKLPRGEKRKKEDKSR